MYTVLSLEWVFPCWSVLQRADLTVDEELKLYFTVWISKSFWVHWLNLGKKLFSHGKLGSSKLSSLCGESWKKSKAFVWHSTWFCNKWKMVMVFCLPSKAGMASREDVGWNTVASTQQLILEQRWMWLGIVCKNSWLLASYWGRQRLRQCFATHGMYCPGVSFPYPSSLTSLSSPGQFLMTWHASQQWQANSLSQWAAISKGAGRYSMPFSSLPLPQLWMERAAPIFFLNSCWDWPSHTQVSGGEMGREVCASI